MPAAKTARKANKNNKTNTGRTIAPINFRLRVLYKSGVTQDYLHVADHEVSFENFRDAYKTALTSNGAKYGTYKIGTNTTITIDWREVVAVQTWQD